MQYAPLTNRELHQKNKMSVDTIFPRKLLYYKAKYWYKMISSQLFISSKRNKKLWEKKRDSGISYIEKKKAF